MKVYVYNPRGVRIETRGRHITVAYSRRERIERHAQEMRRRPMAIARQNVSTAAREAWKRRRAG